MKRTINRKKESPMARKRTRKRPARDSKGRFKRKR